MSTSEVTVSKPLQWTMGEQPNWIGVEAEGELPSGLLDELLADGVCKSLMKRGYAIAPLTDDLRESASSMDSAMRAFCDRTEAEKVNFVSLSGTERCRHGDAAVGPAGDDGERQRHSPNEYHGFARVEGLKEQFMIRIGGQATDLFYPGSFPETRNDGDDSGGGKASSSSSSSHFGLSSVALYQKMDQLCRDYLTEVASQLDIEGNKLARILDPVHNAKAVPTLACNTSSDGGETDSMSPGTVGDGAVVTTDYHVPHYISSSLLDVFHYYPRSRQEYSKPDDAPKRHLNNHLSHTDSGIMTAVLSSAEPGLEVYDQSLEKWIRLEQLIHNRLLPDGEASPSVEQQRVFARYVMAFLGDSCIYLAPDKTKPCLHRVSCSRPERRRFAYVFKQRTQAEATAPRYQEDYILANIQHKALSAAAAVGQQPE